MTAWASPTGYGDPTYDDWTNAGNMYSSDNNYGTSNSAGDQEDLDGFTYFGSPSAGEYEVIDGMRVRIEAHVAGIGSTTKATIAAALSWDDGTSWTSFYSAIWDGGTDVEQEITSPPALDGTSWGRYWDPSEMSHLRCRIKLVKIDSGMTCYVDRVQVGKDSHMASDLGFPGGLTDDTEIIGIGL